MTQEDKISFKSMMDTLATLYQKQPLDQDTLRVWFYKLERFEFNQVTRAFDKWVDQSRFMPTPSDILQLVKEKPIEYMKLEAPKLSQVENKKHADKLLGMIQEKIPQEDKNLKDMRAWAHRIIANPKKYPPISLEFAKEAINAK
jgi:hypothetical protein